jgi:hypothetical protein
MGFGGPSVLSANGVSLGRSSGQTPLSLRPYLGTNVRWDTRIGDPPPGETEPGSAQGFHGLWGLYGVYRGPRYLVSVDYQGFYRYYTRGRARNGINHVGEANYVRQIGQGTDFFAAVGVSTLRYGLVGHRTPLLLDQLPEVGGPNEEVFDSPARAYRAALGMRHQLTERLAIRMDGGGFEIQRAQNLISTRGGNGSAGVSYALAHNKNIGLSYLYNYFFFPNGYGQSTIHTLSLTYNHQFSPVWNMSFGVGALRAETDRLLPVSLDEDLAELTGQPVVLEAVHNLSYRPVFRVTVQRGFERSNLTFLFMRSAKPGNGFITSSIRESWGAVYGYTATEKMHVSGSFMGYSHSAITQEVGRFTTLGGGVSMTYQLYRMIHLTAQLDARHWVVSDSALRRDRVAAMIGLAFSPGSMPLSIW